MVATNLNRRDDMFEFQKRVASFLENALQLFRSAESHDSTNLPNPTKSQFSDPRQTGGATHFQITGVEGGYIPELEDPERDYDSFRRLVSLSDSDSPLSDDVFALNDIHVTPWAAARMGAHLADFTEDIDGPRALRAATIAMQASRKVRSKQLAMGVLLDVGNLFCRYGDYDGATKCFEGILTIPWARGSSERVAAHLGMANIYYLAREYREAAWHYDKCLPYLRRIMKEEGQKGILENAFRSYSECKEYGGVMYCLRKINPEYADRLEKSVGKLAPPLNEAMLTVARLNLLGDSSAASRLLSAWGVT
jgi:tetratricopeptide (TPR) repeat protein